MLTRDSGGNGSAAMSVGSSDAARASPRSVGIDGDRMGREVNHRISNCLSMIASLVRMQARDIGQRGGSLSSRDVETLLAGIGVRIEAVAGLHRRLSTAPQSPTVNLRDQLEALCGDFVAMLANRGQVALSLELDETIVVESQAVLLVLWIVSEMVTNAIKYAHPAGAPGRIRIAGHRQADGTLLLDIADDGVGLPEGFDPQTDGGFGFQLVHTLARHLGAQVSFMCAGIGLQFRLSIPVRR